ncbi:hypothetical protein SAMN05661096_03487 [Marivirga sericea]|uniref:Uncharacterized protein n=1 Tax=Marivirga sericea TaxID=1028 RepID=A0A1X7L4I5_9BACT|nr:hypothetical protein [Marivirga sericea]SMG48547.1 hypothetical protein SAMN05661096_03487 [Marivirga sericea]
MKVLIVTLLFMPAILLAQRNIADLEYYFMRTEQNVDAINYPMHFHVPFYIESNFSIGPEINSFSYSEETQGVTYDSNSIIYGLRFSYIWKVLPVFELSPFVTISTISSDYTVVAQNNLVVEESSIQKQLIFSYFGFSARYLFSSNIFISASLHKYIHNIYGDYSIDVTYDDNSFSSASGDFSVLPKPEEWEINLGTGFKLYTKRL